MNTRLILGGLKSYLPIDISRYKGTGGSTSGRYCYSVWLRHLSRISDFVGDFNPGNVVEIGPGDSLGLGFAALLTGASSYTGLDVVAHSTAERNENVLDELLALFTERAPVPAGDEFPLLRPQLADYAFPDRLIDGRVLEERLSPQYAARLAAAARNPEGSGGLVRFCCPWSQESVASSSANLVISHVALQVMGPRSDGGALERNVAAMARWLAPGGVMSHQIDFSSPGGTPWNHHWAYGDSSWRLIRGRRPYHENRVSLSEYVALFESVGCRVVGVDAVASPGLLRDEVASRFRWRPAEDYTTSAALIVTVKA